MSHLSQITTMAVTSLIGIESLLFGVQVLRQTGARVGQLSPNDIIIMNALTRKGEK